MKLVAATTAALIMASSAAFAEDVTVAGQTFLYGAEFDANYTTGKAEWALDFTPYVGYSLYGIDLTAETTIDVLDINDSSELFQGLDLKATYEVGTATAYAEVGADKDWSFGDVTMGVKYKF